MPHPEKVAIPRPCPECGGRLLRKTEDPEKPLGMVGCSGCAYKAPIAEYVKSVQNSVKAEAQEKIRESKK